MYHSPDGYGSNGHESPSAPQGSLAVVNKQQALWYLSVAWVLVTFPGILAVSFGLTAPYLPPGQIPFLSEDGFFVALFVVPFGGALVLQLIRNYWQAQSMRSIGLSETRGFYPWSRNRAGIIDGRTVMSEYRSPGKSHNHNNGPRNFTVMAAQCDADEGVIIAVPGAENSIASSLADMPLPTSEVDGYTVFGNAEYANAILTPRVRNALDDADLVREVRIGDISALFREADNGSSKAGMGLAASMISRTQTFDGHVRTSVRGYRRDPDDLRDMIEVVTAVADAAEAAPPHQRA